jgi:uncharacterized protein (DUF924 family)
MAEPTPRVIVSYWLGESPASPAAAFARHELWYRGGRPIDDEIRERFGHSVTRARAGGLAEWDRSPESQLALVILLDQFTRNIYRGTPEAYSGDPLALAVALRAVAAGRDRDLCVPGRIFLYHPFHHSETLVEQDRGVALLERLAQESPPEWRDYVRRSVEGFRRHRDTVARFGRFPHRNPVLGRISTPEEVAFLAADGSTYGQARGADRRPP